MILQDALRIAQDFLDRVVRHEHDLEIVIASCSEDDRDWRFGYNTRAFLEEGDVASSLVGNGPVVVPKSGGEAYLGSLFGES